MQLDIIIFEFFNNFVGINSVLDSIFLFFADDLDIVLFLVVVFFLLIHDHFPKLKFFSKKELALRVKEIIYVSLASGLAWVMARLLKDVFTRPRPFLELSEVNLLLQQGGYDSFPSGHATFFFALALIVYLGHKKAGIFLGIGALIISISRVVVGLHFPSDILGGFVLGFLVILVINSIKKQYPQK